MKLRIATYNIHNGSSRFNRRIMVHKVHRHVRTLDAEIVFLQEVQSENPHLALRVPRLNRIFDRAALTEL